MNKVYLLIAIISLMGCGGHKPIKTVENLDLDRFMGKWHVIANIPTFIEKDAYNAIEIYEREESGLINTLFQFNKGNFDGELVQYRPVAEVIDKKSNAIWEMQFIWPIKTDYRVMYVESDYSITIIGRLKRDYVWIMARQSEIDTDKYQELLEFIHKEGYDKKDVQLVPQNHNSKEMAWRT